MSITVFAVFVILFKIVSLISFFKEQPEPTQEKTAWWYYDQYLLKRTETQARFESCKQQLEADNVELKALYSGFQSLQTGEYMTNRVSSFTSEQTASLNLSWQAEK